MTSLEAVQAAYPGWTIRRDVGPDWTCWTARRKSRSSPRRHWTNWPPNWARSTGQQRATRTVTRARQLVAEHHQPLTMTPGDLRHLLARWQRAATELLDVLTDRNGWI